MSRLIPPRPSVSDVEFICARDLLYCRPQVGQSSLITGRVCVLRLCRSTGGNKTGSSFKASAMICSFVWVVANPAKRNGRQKHGHQHCDNQHNVHVSQLESCSNGNGPCRRPDNRRQKMRSLFFRFPRADILWRKHRRIRTRFVAIGHDFFPRSLLCQWF